MLQFLDYFLTVFHTTFVAFVLFGWAFKATRKAHLMALALTLAAWLVLGFWYGLGYCPLTDWHWDIKRELGERRLPNSFTKYIFDKVTGLDADKQVVDIVTALGLAFGVVMGAVGYRRGFRRRRG